MAKFNLNAYTSADGLGFPLNFRRGNPNPLDNSSVWASLTAAQNYAKTDPVAYVGQVLTVLDVVDGTANAATVYCIQNEAGDLARVGTVTLGDDTTIIKNEDNTLSIKGYADAAEGAQLVKTADGLAWIVPSTTTVEGLQTAVAALQETVGDSTKGLVKQVADNKAAIETLNANSTTKGSVAYQIAQIVAGADASFDTLKEIADWIGTHTTDAATMNSQINTNKTDIASLKELVGSEAVATQIANAIDAALKSGANAYVLPEASATQLGGVKVGKNLTMTNGVLDATDTIYEDATTSTSGLMSGADKTKLDGIADGATKVIVDTELSNSSVNAIQNKAVKAALDNKSDVGHTHDEYVNQNAFGIIKIGAASVEADQAIDTLELAGGDNVTITPDAENDKIVISAKDTTYNDATASEHGLMSTADKTKLDGISAGAQVNVIEAINSQSLTVGAVDNKSVNLEINWVEF